MIPFHMYHNISFDNAIIPYHTYHYKSSLNKVIYVSQHIALYDDAM
jgi:hypothetical protein